jgi:hypothetical protein
VLRIWRDICRIWRDICRIWPDRWELHRITWKYSIIQEHNTRWMFQETFGHLHN